MNIIDQVRRKRLVFTVTTGRSGTKYLSCLLSLLADFTCEHEAEPAFHYQLRSVQTCPGKAKVFWLERKLPYIASLSTSYYCDTSHLISKGFLEALLDLELVPDLIFLKRRNRDVARSYLQLGAIPGRTRLGLIYLSSPTDPTALRVLDWKKLTDYQLCYWYTLEMDRRHALYSQLFRGTGSKHSYLLFDEMVNGDVLRKLCNELDLPPLTVDGARRYPRLRKFRRNSKTQNKREIGIISYEDEELDLIRRIEDDEFKPLEWNFREQW